MKTPALVLLFGLALLGADVAAQAAPDVPPAHPLKGYVDHMVAEIAALKVLAWVSLCAKCVFIAVLVYFSVWLVRLIRRVERLCDQGERAMSAAAENRELTAGLLRTVKGWSVVQVAGEATAAAKVSAQVETIPERTADRVVEKIKAAGESSGDSAKLPTVPVQMPPQ